MVAILVPITSPRIALSPTDVVMSRMLFGNLSMIRSFINVLPLNVWAFFALPRLKVMTLQIICGNLNGQGLSRPYAVRSASSKSETILSSSLGS